MRKRKLFGRKSLIMICIALIGISGWEACVRLDAMYKPIVMFFRMALGEHIPFETAMSYFDWSIFEAPLWLTGCILAGLLALFMIRSRGGRMLLIPLSLALCLYGLTREGSFLTDFWRLIQPALLLLIAILSAVNLFSRSKTDSPNKKEGAQPDHPPRIKDAPRLHRTGSSRERHSA